MKITRTGPEKGMGLHVVLDEGEVLGNFVGPAEISIPDAPGNKESDEIERLKKEGKITIPAWVEPAPAVPASVSDRQFFQALAKNGIITTTEALAAVKVGELPVTMQNALDAIPDEDDKFDIEMQLSGATNFERAHPSTAALGQILGYDGAALDDLWRLAATL